ncbi:MAG: hypothetical protein DWQ04_06650 [Chloroflexi bacterium]|nr:MAG: hypothetical protein DWQ04_06650 [Chloroflexota bacterium]
MKTIETSNLTPAESMLILDPNTIQGKLMMKYTLLDLLFKKALFMDVREEKRLLGFKKVERRYIRANPTYPPMKLKRHQTIFYLSHLSKFMADGLELSDYARKIRDKVGGPTKFMREYVSEGLVSQGYFIKERKRVLLLFPIDKYSLSEKGLDAQEKIKKMLEEGERNLADWMENDPAQAKAYFLICGPLMLLLDIELNQLKEWRNSLSKLNFDVQNTDMFNYLWHDPSFWHMDGDNFSDSDFDLPDFTPDFNLDSDFDADFDFDFDFDFDMDFDFDAGDGGGAGFDD